MSAIKEIRSRLHRIVFGVETRAGRLFDILLLWIILLSVAIVVFESIPEFGNQYSAAFIYVEWIFTILFTIEFVLRLWISPKPLAYLFSFWGVIDLMSILPTYLTMIGIGTHYTLVVRIFRLLRVFRVFKLVRFNREAASLANALRTSLYKISIFFMFILSIVILLGTLMYVIEGSEHGFTSIPQSIYWAIITVTTVGYGDIVPGTVIGKLIASAAMIIGYAIIAVPTGIVTSQMMRPGDEPLICSLCDHKNPKDANYCNHCGDNLIHEALDQGKGDLLKNL